MPVIDTLTYFGALRGLSTSDGARAGTASCCVDVGLEDALTKKAGELSRGMHQKAQLIATIINEPDLLIVDEPFQGLDPLNATMLKSLLLEQRERGAAVVMSTHDMEDAQIAVRPHPAHRQRPARCCTARSTTVRRAFSDGAVEVVGRDLPTDSARACTSAAHATSYDGSVRYLLSDGATAQDLFRELGETPAEVERFALEAPNLAEIFVRAVAGDQRAERGRDERTSSCASSCSSPGATTCAPCAGAASCSRRSYCPRRWPSCSPSRAPHRRAPSSGQPGPILLVNESIVSRSRPTRA